MSRESEPNEIQGMILGFLLLMLLHALAGVIIFVLGMIVGPIFGNYSFLLVWIVGAMGFLFWQLLYVIPLAIWLKRRNNPGMMKGVIIGATVTALMNGVCFVALRP